VVKIEEAGGDPERFWVRLGQIDFSGPNGESIMFKISNRNKKGLWLDIHKEKGRDIFHRLIKGADVFLTNLRKSTKAKMGLDYATLVKINPRIIHANVSGYGPEGPMADLGAFDALGLARSGMTYLTGLPEPQPLSIGVLDQMTAIAASHAIITALFVRERRGIGQEVHVSLYSAGLWLTQINLVLANLLKLDPNVRPVRTEHSPLRNRFLCQDGKWIMGTNHPESKYWPIFCEVTGRPDLINDPRFADDKARAANSAELIAIFDEVFLTKTRDEWMAIFLEKGLMFCSVQHISEVAGDTQALINRYVVDFEDPHFGRVKFPGYPVHFSAAQAGTQSLGPEMGEHTDLVMRELGYTDQEIESLRQEDVIK